MNTVWYKCDFVTQLSDTLIIDHDRVEAEQGHEDAQKIVLAYQWLQPTVCKVLPGTGREKDSHQHLPMSLLIKHLPGKAG